ncbi:uncharacterized protein MAM_05556 [Metarhizium album ARSEF 1941]|uniref:CCZ1/INTU/HSP4 first Longin domain-containing protein n=1 Tax=Metarhizium album (strain ARSEF 1941) TaxID=1081103 RepID=A0A0B2WRG7_METAS|nr:uncharacterized protein MAM_05556 [Metarhizium album ARSEF 1941]KHN96613.1 hypothetical protein MAM_05556 [Metarhizium album ARSEF 1941]
MASTAAAAPGTLVPAQLGFLAIFNPSLGNTDDTIDDQIVYYASETTQSPGKRRRRTRGRPTEAISQEERHERLRQIGLAQGIINFSRGFADDASLDTVDTEKSRVIAHELEPGWWILASINLTKVPLPPRLVTKSTASEARQGKYDYSSREMKPAPLLVRDLLRAHSIFLLHHDTSLSALFVRSRRAKFTAVLSRYWDLFLSTWNVMLHGNPARSIFGGINVAASGELGVGVGEEERGSGEREVLEGLVGRIEGLVDLVVSKFGTEEPDDEVKTHRDSPDAQPWLGTGEEPAAEDGAIFLGTGALSRRSVRDVTQWMEDLYQWGDHAYGVIDSPTSMRGRRARRRRESVGDTRVAKAAAPASADEERRQRQPEQIQTEPQSQRQPKQAQKAKDSQDADAQEQPPPPEAAGDLSSKGGSTPPPRATEDGKLDKMLSYMKLGYGSYWTMPGSSNSNTPTRPQSDKTPAPSDTSTSKPGDNAAATPSASPATWRPKLPKRSSSDAAHGHYLIGLKGSISEPSSDSEPSCGSSTHNNSRTLLRTINIELESKASSPPATTIIKDFAHPASPLTQSQVAGSFLPGYASHDLNKSEKLRVVVYVNRPFVFTFFFRLHTDSLAWDSLYRSLHYQLAPLKKPLLASTRYRPGHGQGHGRPAPGTMFNLVWDPKQLTSHSTIPNIPESSASDAWSRADAVNTHLHLLNIHASTRPRVAGSERTHKTNRGWWIVWTRLLGTPAPAPAPAPGSGSGSGSGSGAVAHDEQPPSPGLSETEASREGGGGGAEHENQEHTSAVSKEIFLIRRASDHAGFRSLSAGDGGDGPDSASNLVQGIGVDTRRYVEQLLSFL